MGPQPPMSPSLPLLLLAAGPWVSSETRTTTQPIIPYAGAERTNFDAPVLASDFDGTNHVVVWADTREGSISMMAARVSPQGAVLEPTGKIVAPASEKLIYGECGIAFDGTNHLLVYLRNATQNGYVGAELVGKRLDKNLVPIDAAPFPISNKIFAQVPAVAFDGMQFWVAWASGDMASTTAMNRYRWAARVSRTGQVLDANGISLDTVTPGHETRMSVASAQGVTLVVWDAPVSMLGEKQARFRRLNTNGMLVDAAPVTLGAPSRYGIAANVASNGTRFLVTWLFGTYNGAASMKVLAARVGVSGAPIDATPIELAASGTTDSGLDFYGSTAMPVWAGAEWHVAWGRNTSAGAALDGIRLGDDGIKRGGIDELIDHQSEYFAASASGTSVLWTVIGWSDDQTRGPLIEARRFSPTLQALDAAMIDVGQAAPFQWVRSAASNGSVVLTSWFERTSGWGWEVRAGRVDATGAPLDGTGLLVGRAPFPGSQIGFEISSTWDGQDFVLVWDEERPVNMPSRIFFSRVTPGGVVRDVGGVAVSSTIAHDPAIASVGGGASLVCWRYAGSPFTGSCARLNNGVVVDAMPFSFASQVTTLSVGAVNGTYLLAWCQVPVSGGTTGTLYARTVSPGTGAMGPLITLSSGAYWPGRLSVRGSATGAVIVWRPAGPAGLTATFFDASATMKGTVTLDSATNAAFGSAAQAVGGDWLIAWVRQDYYAADEIRMQRFSGAGTPLDMMPAPAFTADPVGLGDVVSLGSGWALAYSRYDDTPGIANQRARVRRVLPEMPDGGEPQPPDAGTTIDAGSVIDGGSEVDGGSGGEIVDAGAVPGISITSSPSTSARCDDTWRYELAISGEAPITWSLGDDAPEGLTISAVNGSGGTLTWMPTHGGAFDVEVRASNPAGATTQRFTVNVECESSKLKQGCGCATGGVELLLAAALLALRTRRRSR